MKIERTQTGGLKCLWTRLFEPLLVILGLYFIMSPAIGMGMNREGKRSWSAFPILMYDTDIGWGYGGKVKLVDFLAGSESFDLILFNSSKGERWYVFSFSIPDFEIRQGKVYGVSFDLRAEYDRYLKYFHYGTGPESQKEDETAYTSEKEELQLILGRGLSP